MDALEQRPVLQHATTGNELPQAPGIHLTKRRPDCEYGFGLRGKIEGLVRLVKVDPMHPVPVVEEHRRLACSVCQEPMKAAVQAFRKTGVLLVKVDEIRRPLRLERMPPLFEAVCDPWFRVFLSGKGKNDIPAFVREWHTVGERVLPRCPSDVYPHAAINPRPRFVERLVAQRLDHPLQLGLSAFARHFGNQTNDPWHGRPSLGLGYRAEMATVPGAPECAEWGNNRLWKMFNQPAVKTQAESRRTDVGE